MRLINADALCEQITDYAKDYDLLEESQAELFRMALRLVTKQPTVDAVPAEHGHWKLNRNCSEKSYYCSVCLEGESDYGKDNYCPNCGAKMDETN